MSRMRARVVRPLRAALAGFVLVAAVVVGSTAPAIGAPSRDASVRTIEPWDPAAPPSAPPAFAIAAACTRSVGPGQFEAVFGYDHPGDTSALVKLAADPGGRARENVIVRSRRGHGSTQQIEQLGPQVTLFKPGHHPYAFAVRYSAREDVTWQVAVPAKGINAGQWKVTVTPRRGVRCGRDVPEHFAVVQYVSLLWSPTNDVWTPAREHLVSYDIRFEVGAVRAACSGDGQVVGLDSYIGWDDTLTNLEPIEAAYEVAIPRATFQMSHTTLRRVLDITQPMQWGGPIADVTAFCFFDGRVLPSDEFWAERDGHGARVDPTVVDGQVVRLAVSEFAPLGVRLR